MQPGSASPRDPAWASIHHLNTAGLNHCRSLQYQIESPHDWPWLLDHGNLRGDPSCWVAPNTSAWWGSPQGSGPGQPEESFHGENTDHVHFYRTKDFKKCNKNVGFFGGEGAVCKGHITFLSLFLINLAYQMEDLLNSLPDRFPSAEEPAESVWNEETFGKKDLKGKKQHGWFCLWLWSKTIWIFTAL